MAVIRFVGLDISNKCGFVALDESGNVLRAKELYGVGDKEPKRMVTLGQEILAHLKPDDVIVIEGFAINFGKSNKSRSLDTIHGLGWLVRSFLFMKGHKFRIVTPSQRQAFVGESGYVLGDQGKKKKVSGDALKALVMAKVREMYSFDHSSDNVNDAYILAMIALEIHRTEQWSDVMSLRHLPKFQEEIIQGILNPKKKKSSKPTAKRSKKQ